MSQQTGGYAGDVFDGLGTWWSAVGLWLTQQWFPVQFVLVTAVLVPLCCGVTRVLDGLGDAIAASRRRNSGEFTAEREI